MKFIADFDRVGIALSISAILILFYFGLLNPQMFQTHWVAYTFWMTGFFGSISLGLVRRTKIFSLSALLNIGMWTGIIIIVWAGLNYSYATAIEASTTLVSLKMESFAIGICEELFFGVFLLGILINWIGLHPILAIPLTALSHAVYHVPQWGVDFTLVALFTIVFIMARSMYVFCFPKVGALLGAHGFWNLGVS